MYEELTSRLLSLSEIEAIQQEPGICRVTMECIGAIREIAIEAADAIEAMREMVATAYNELANVIQSYEESKPSWIPVTEQLPKDCTPVQVCYIGYHSKEIGSDMLACRYEGLWCYWDGEPCSYVPCQVEITHWMPLPKPPKEETE